MSIYLLATYLVLVGFVLGLRIGKSIGEASREGVGDADEYKVGGSD